MKRLLCLLLLCGCTREVREQSQVHQVATGLERQSEATTVDTVIHASPVTTVIEEYEQAVPVSTPTSTPIASPELRPAIPAPAITQSAPRLIRRTTITQGPVVQETHATSTRVEVERVQVQQDVKKQKEADTHVGPPWWVWPVCLAVVLTAAWLYLRLRRGLS